MATSLVRQPLPVVTVNGIAATGVEEIEVESTAFLSADRFRLRAALGVAGAVPWSSVPSSVEVGIVADGLELSLITGDADIASFDPLRGEIELAGRDYTSRFIGAQLEQSYDNQTSSEIAAALAAKHGLQAHVTPTSTLVGRYYQNSRTRLSLIQHARASTEWDLLCWLAQIEGFDIWVQDLSLFFQPVRSVSPSLIVAPDDCLRLSLHHALDIAAGVSVSVRSWDCTSQSTVVQTVQGPVLLEGATRRSVVRPNLSPDDAQALALQMFNQISSHERRVQIEMPGDLTTQPRGTLSLINTGTDFDGLYFVSAVSRHLSFAHGFTQTIEAKNYPWTPS